MKLIKFSKNCRFEHELKMASTDFPVRQLSLFKLKVRLT